MKNSIQKKFDIYASNRKKKKLRKKAVTLMAAAVAFCTVYALILPAVTLDQEQCGLTAHTHSIYCYTQTAKEEDAKKLTCETPESENHRHDELCYGAWELTCAFEEHIHTDACFAVSSADTLTLDDQSAVNELIYMLDQLPTAEDAETALLAYEASEDMGAYEEYYIQLGRTGRHLYDIYQKMDSDLQTQITNIDKLYDLSWIWSAVTFASTDAVNVTAVNQFSWSGYGGALIVYNSSGTTVRNAGMGESSFLYWYAVVVEKVNGQFVVEKIYTDDGSTKANVSVSGNGFILLYHTSTLGATVNVNVGDHVTLSSDFWKKTSAYSNGKVYGTVTFTSPSAEKTAKDNSNDLTIVPGADTRSFIQLNLYNYGSDSTGVSINKPYNGNKSLPGFQQGGGTSNIPSLNAFNSVSNFNFGDIMTSDPNSVDGAIITGSSANPVGINVVTNNANYPISYTSNVIYKTLLNGYPALADSTSLAYLFGEQLNGTNYSKKVNEQSVNGLFQYNKVSGAYSFNSRTNFAQYNESNDTFTLYDEIFTPNFIMYPFGNFMPFNDIVNDSKQVSQIDKDYFYEQLLHANYMYNQTSDERYAQLSRVLSQFIDYAAQSGWDENWTSEDVLDHYFSHAPELPEATDDKNNYNQISLHRLYSLDYDVESDFYFGMDMSMTFMQPKNGMTGSDVGDNSKGWTTLEDGTAVRAGDPDGIPDYPLVFEFSGDDDVWIYIDGVLFLDLSGIHRHVGGKIDFVSGKVYYYSLNTKTGDVNTDSPYKTLSFSEILTAAGKSTDCLNENGTFKDYSTHTFNFYYMERGSGSSVCRMNFNFPLLQKNSISVSKELTVDEEDKLITLGNPDFLFQVLAADSNGKPTDNLFIGSGVNYNIYDKSNNLIGVGTTDQNGVFKLKAGQRAEFSSIPENAGKYYVRELLSADAFSQYGTITVNGSSITTSYNVDVGSDSFTGVLSPVKDASDGTTVFTFTNQVTFSKLGSLEISKELNAYQEDDINPKFQFYVALDGAPLPAKTAYTVDGAETLVQTEGIVIVPAGSTAKLDNIISGSRFTVSETETSSIGYTVTYSGSDGVITDGSSASGSILTNSIVNVTAVNSENGAVLSIPLSKLILCPDGTERTFTFELTQVTDKTGKTEVGGGKHLTTDISVTDTADSEFALTYLKKDISALPAKFYYRITERADNRDQIGFDETAYVAEVTISDEFIPDITGIYKNEGGSEASVIEFTNTLLGSLTFTKTVTGTQTDQDFTFTLELSIGTSGLESLPDTCTAVLTNPNGEQKTESVIFTDGKLNFSLKAGESITLQSIPHGTEYTVTETETNDYFASWTKPDGTSVKGNIISGNVQIGNNSLICTNSWGYELPETGGVGTRIYQLTGAFFAVVGGGLLMYRYAKRRKERGIS